MLFGALEMVLGKWNSEADPFLKESTYIYTLRAGRMLRFFFQKEETTFIAYKEHMLPFYVVAQWSDYTEWSTSQGNNLKFLI